MVSDLTVKPSNVPSTSLPLPPCSSSFSALALQGLGSVVDTPVNIAISANAQGNLPSGVLLLPGTGRTPSICISLADDDLVEEMQLLMEAGRDWHHTIPDVTYAARRPSPEDDNYLTARTPRRLGGLADEPSDEDEDSGEDEGNGEDEEMGWPEFQFRPPSRWTFSGMRNMLVPLTSRLSFWSGKCKMKISAVSEEAPFSQTHRLHRCYSQA